jgi:hypothetical protein
MQRIAIQQSSARHQRIAIVHKIASSYSICAMHAEQDKLSHSANALFYYIVTVAVVGFWSL